MHSPSSTARPAAPHRERGIALFVVIVFVMLSMLLALWASRTAIFNEMVVGNDADYQRAFEAAQSLIQDAELDIQQFDTTGYRADDNAALIELDQLSPQELFSRAWQDNYGSEVDEQTLKDFAELLQDVQMEREQP